MPQERLVGLSNHMAQSAADNQHPGIMTLRQCKGKVAHHGKHDWAWGRSRAADGLAGRQACLASATIQAQPEWGNGSHPGVASHSLPARQINFGDPTALS
jgi:hypothetical protein